MKKYLLLISFLLFFLQKSLAQYTDFNPNLQKAYTELTQLDFQSSKAILNKENPKNLYRIWLEDYSETLNLLNTENYQSFQLLKENEDKRLELIEKMDKNSAHYRFLKAEILLHWALVKMKFGYEVKAAWNIISAYKLLEQNQKKFPAFLPNLKYLSVLHILIGSVPENFTWATRLMGLNGSIQQGLNELQQAEKDPIFGKEAKFYQLFVASFILEFSENTNQEIVRFVEQNPDYQSILFLGVAASIKNNRSKQALSFFQKYPNHATLTIFDFYKGEISLQQGDYSHAINAYSNYLKNFQGKSFLKETCYKLFLAYFLKGEETKAKEFIEKIPSLGNTAAEADKAAQKFYEAYKRGEPLPNKGLMKARLAFDGGFYVEALQTIDKLSENSLSDAQEKAEFNYRKGRIQQKMNNFEEAILNFKRAIYLNEGHEWYFGASSALQLGYIYLLKNEKSTAKYYFEKAISYKKHAYKNSVDTKARAAMNQIKF